MITLATTMISNTQSKIIIISISTFLGLMFEHKLASSALYPYTLRLKARLKTYTIFNIFNYSCHTLIPETHIPKVARPLLWEKLSKEKLGDYGVLVLWNR